VAQVWRLELAFDCARLCSWLQLVVNMSGYWVLLLLAAYFIVLRWVLPRFGVPT
jgi:hypothetical protein